MGKHLNLSQRIEIENKLNEGKSFRQIADTIGKPHTTVSREVESRRIFKKGNSFNTTNMKCKKIEKAPFVCNGCPNKNKCRKNKYFYFAEDADNDYKKRKRIVSKNKSERKEQNCRIGRTYKEFTDYIEKNNIDYYVEMDTVEGIKGHSLLLTLCILPYNFLLAYKIEDQTISESTEKINELKKELGFELFHKIFPIILTDNGSEFKRPDLIEDNGNDVIKTKVFFCDPNRSDQKGTIDFVKRAVVYFGCKLKIIQTDNGAEFTHIKKTDRIHPLDTLCNSLHIEHKLIRPRTPRHNGKVERSHRNDQQRFYQFLKFYSYDDLLIQMKAYLKRSNNIPMQIFNWKTPLETRNELSKINK